MRKRASTNSRGQSKLPGCCFRLFCLVLSAAQGAYRFRERNPWDLVDCLYLSLSALPLGALWPALEGFGWCYGMTAAADRIREECLGWDDE